MNCLKPSEVLGNLVGGLLFTGLALYYTHATRPVPVTARPHLKGAESVVD